MKILFVSHDASRTGAPILLLSLVRWLTAYRQEEMLMLVIDGGDLLEKFRETGKCLQWNIPLVPPGILKRLYQKIRFTNNRIKHQQNVLRRIHRFQPDLIYYNSVESCRLVPLLGEKYKQARSILHVHELETVIRQINTGQCFEEAKPFLDRYLAASDLVKTNLVDNHHIPPDQIDRVYEYIDISQWDLERKEKSQTSGKFIIGSAGGVHWRKGFAFFILLAAELQRRRIKDFECRWTGRMDEEHQAIVFEDLKKLDLSDCVKFLGESSEMDRFYRQMDVFVITSREDPYPVVALEAALFSIPIICWNRGTGTLEFVDRGGGLSVDYLDVGGMADAVLELKNDPEKRKKLGGRAHELALEHDVGLAGKKIYGIVKGLIRK